VRKHEPDVFEWDGMRVRYSFQVAQIMSAQLLPSFISSGVNLDKCLVQDLFHRKEGLMPLVRNTSRNREAAAAIQ